MPTKCRKWEDDGKPVFLSNKAGGILAWHFPPSGEPVVGRALL